MKVFSKSHELNDGAMEEGEIMTLNPKSPPRLTKEEREELRKEMDDLSPAERSVGEIILRRKAEEVAASQDYAEGPMVWPGNLGLRRLDQLLNAESELAEAREKTQENNSLRDRVERIAELLERGRRSKNPLDWMGEALAVAREESQFDVRNNYPAGGLK
jgi:hypothetical protein